MAHAPTLVDFVREVSQTTPRAKSAKPKSTVSFAGGAVAHLDPTNPRERVWSEVLESLRASGQPAYVEFDTSTGRMTSLLLPQKYKVVEIRQVSKDGDLQIEFDRSHAVHYLRREHPRFKELRKLLEDSDSKKRTVLVTDSLDMSAIVDVRPAESYR